MYHKEERLCRYRILLYS